MPLINDVQINEDVLESINKDDKWLEEQVKQAGYNDASDIFLGEIEDGKLSFTGYNQK